jgi:hypothetical protein
MLVIFCYFLSLFLSRLLPQNKNKLVGVSRSLLSLSQNGFEEEDSNEDKKRSDQGYGFSGFETNRELETKRGVIWI